MKKIFIFILFLSFNWSLFSQVDNIYGDFLISKTKKRISMNLDKVKLVELLKALSAQSGLNFICTEAIKERELTIYLDNVPLRDAIDIIFKANNLSYDYYPQANLFVVKELGKPSLELKTKVYRLKYVRVKGFRLQEEIESGLEEEEEEGGTSKVQIKEAIEGVLSEYGKVIEEPLTNSLVVVDVPSQFPIIDRVIESLDKPQPKVLIEAEILDVSKISIDKLGVNWPEDLIKLDITGARATAFPFWGSKKNSSANLATLEMDATAGGWKDISWSANNFGPSILTVIGAELALKFLKSQTDTRLLARPKVLTLSGETAEIKITTDEAIGIKKEESEEGGRIEYSIERTETGTKLKVTPQVNPSTKEITLVIETVQRVAKNSGFTTTATAFVTGTVKNPEERSTRTVVRLKDGEVLLIGGLIRREEVKDSTKVPFLSKIPFLGALFKGKTKDKKERELLIFITPHIVDEFSSLPVFKKSKLREQSMSFSRKKTIMSLLDRFSKVKQ
ncbi:MAG: hypothetical protein B6D56_06505 [Candidatus Omnitrophica bacterium 4484_70.1]|nr:MAG: hypothetical protein B6D56_06505 [Candidatus Omnitrophica bacterium 4484_70.1]